MRPIMVLMLLLAGCKEEPPKQAPPKQEAPKADLDAKAKELAQRFIIVDGHVDIPYRLIETKNEKGEITEDISGRTPKGDFDWVRAREGGLDAPFMSIFVPSSYQEKR